MFSLRMHYWIGTQEPLYWSLTEKNMVAKHDPLISQIRMLTHKTWVMAVYLNEGLHDYSHGFETLQMLQIWQECKQI